MKFESSRLSKRGAEGQAHIARAAHHSDLRADRSRCDGVSKSERRGNGGNGLRALANTLDGQVTVVHNAAKNALVDIDALNFVEAHLKGPPLNETGLVDDPHVANVGLGGPAVEPSGCRLVQRSDG